MEKVKIIISHLATVGWNILFGYGLLSIAYGYWFMYTGAGWAVLDTILKFLGFLLVIVSVIATSVSIYIPSHKNTPSLLSVYLSAPSVIILMILIGSEALYFGRYPHDAVLTGAALIGLSGAMHQMIPRIHENALHNIAAAVDGGTARRP